MADQQSASVNKSGVSPARKAASTVILLVALAVLGIELRAGLGQRNSARALEAKSEDGFFANLSLADAQSMLAFAPTENILQETELETVYHYSWFSLLRPLAQQPKSELFLVARKTDPPIAVSFYTEAEDAAHLPASGSGAGSDAGASETSGMGDMPVSIDGPGVESIIPRSSGRPAGDEESSNEPAAAEPSSSEPAAPNEGTPEPE